MLSSSRVAVIASHDVARPEGSPIVELSVEEFGPAVEPLQTEFKVLFQTQVVNRQGGSRR